MEPKHWWEFFFFNLFKKMILKFIQKIKKVKLAGKNL